MGCDFHYGKVEYFEEVYLISYSKRTVRFEKFLQKKRKFFW